MSDRNAGGSSPDEDLPPRLVDAIDGYLRSKGKGSDGESGTYRRNAERELHRFAAFLADRGIEDLGDVDATTLRQYVRSALTSLDLAPRTVRKYYDYVSAWLGWAQREGLVAEHYGIRESAREPLPDVDTRADGRQQTWRRDQRRTLLAHLDHRAREAVEDRGTAAYAPLRDRSFVVLLAYSGLRGSELLANPEDDRRTGAEWRHFAEGLVGLDVLGKTQEWETRSIPPQARSPLEQWARAFDPEPEWPVVPTFHYPTLYDGLRAAGHDDTDSLSGYADVFEAYRERDARPAAMTTDGARRLMQRLTDEADVDVDDDYLTLHGARRGVGRVLALQQGADAAADQLGNSVTVVEERYSDVLASERAEKTGDAFADHDGDR